MHPLQVQIALRALALLKVGGRMVYSTCSLNPLEDEAVVSELLRRGNGAVRLVDLSDKLPRLRRSSGLRNWHVVDDAGREFHSVEEVPETKKTLFPRSVFPAGTENQELERCMRILPHQQNSGGFFVCMLEKVAEMPVSSGVSSVALTGSVKNEQAPFALCQKRGVFAPWDGRE
mgnify:FL=1